MFCFLPSVWKEEEEKKERVDESMSRLLSTPVFMDRKRYEYGAEILFTKKLIKLVRWLLQHCEAASRLNVQTTMFIYFDMFFFRTFKTRRHIINGGRIGTSATIIDVHGCRRTRLPIAKRLLWSRQKPRTKNNATAFHARDVRSCIFFDEYRYKVNAT